MLIVCSNCAASYDVTATAIGAAGRSVRCVRCRNVWLQQPGAEVPGLVMTQTAPSAPAPASDETVAALRAELAGEASAAAESSQPNPQTTHPDAAIAAARGPSLDDLMVTPTDDAPRASATEGPALSDTTTAADGASAGNIMVLPDGHEAAAGGPEDIESTATRRRIRTAVSRRAPARIGAMPIAIIVLVGVVAALIGWRSSIVRHAPQLASLYATIGLPVNLRGLTFRDVQVSRDTHEGAPVLVVEGSIASAASTAIEVPRLRFAMRNEAGGEVYAWTAMPTREVLDPGETLAFRSRLASPPGEGREVLVRFYTRLDAIAGLR